MDHVSLVPFHSHRMGRSGGSAPSGPESSVHVAGQKVLHLSLLLSDQGVHMFLPLWLGLGWRLEVPFGKS